MSTKEKILQVAEDEFAKHGFDGVSLNDIVKIVGINKATIYHHFKDKRALYQEIIKSKIDILHTNIEEIFDSETDSEKLLKKYIEAIVLTVQDNPNIVPMALREFANFGANVDESLVPHIEIGLSYLAKIIEGLELQEKYKDMNPYALYCLINGTIDTFYVIQMSALPLGGDKDLKQNSKKSLLYIQEFVSNIIIDAIIQKR